jgi:o-succinylbenzoate synthase
MIKARYKKYNLILKRPAGTSRGILHEKTSWFILIYDDDYPEISGIGECGPLKGLSIDDRLDYEFKLEKVCSMIDNYVNQIEGLEECPSINFGLEMAMADLNHGGRKIPFPSDFTSGLDSIAINGLVWMGTFDSMQRQIREKIESGFTCIKLKIGSIDFNEELKLIRSVRKNFPSSDIELRVDANGAFSPEKAMEKLNRLSEFNIHSIEQPIKQGQWDKMAELCKTTPIPIALDEELIGVTDYNEKKRLIDFIQPRFIILKPSLLGGFKASEEWINLASERKIGWWITSALESNIGLNAIAQWAYTLGNKIPQGLGTGLLYVNNIHSPLKINSGRLFFDPEQKWEIPKVLE